MLRILSLSTTMRFLKWYDFWKTYLYSFKVLEFLQVKEAKLVLMPLTEKVDKLCTQFAMDGHWWNAVLAWANKRDGGNEIIEMVGQAIDGLGSTKKQ